MALIFSSGDYNYYESTSSIPNSVAVSVIDDTKTSYEDIPATIEYNGVTYTVVSLYVAVGSSTWGCFKECENLITSPSIPNTVVNMSHAFDGCINLIKAPIIPNSVTSLDYAFSDCTSLKEVLNIPNSVVSMISTFYNCSSLSGDIIAYGAPYQDDAVGIFDETTEKINILVPTQELYNSWTDIIDNLGYVSTQFSVTLVEDTPSYSKAITQNDLKTVLNSALNTVKQELNKVGDLNITNSNISFDESIPHIFVKSGRICSCLFYIQANDISINSRSTLTVGTVSPDFKPLVEVENRISILKSGGTGFVDAALTIDTDGNVKIYNASDYTGVFDSAYIYDFLYISKN